ncbi:MAG: methyltransferase domain-containing protein [Candidatus Rokubacteria bacterium]|nr:methyltransferase domain-containing protein [Candidatus Rokubacteria bacterium]
MTGTQTPAHYDRADLGQVIDAALSRAGKTGALTVDDLAPVDHFHTRGKEATLELAQRAALRADMHVLDVGGGLGGAARLLARDVGCRVTVLDLTEAYVRVGAELTRRTGLADRVTFERGDALTLPFEAASFDAVWTQHSSMNIADKPRLYAELARVLRPGGRLALHELMAGPHASPHFPVPWAREAGASALEAPETVRGILRGLGLRERAWEDQSAMTLAWVRARAAVPGAPPPPLGLHLLLGADTGAMFANLTRNLDEGRVTVVMAVWEKPAA